MKPNGHVEWFTSARAARYLGFVFEADVIKNGEVVHRAGDANLNAFTLFLHRGRRKPKVHWLNNRMRFRQVDLDACVEAEAGSNMGSAKV